MSAEASYDLSHAYESQRKIPYLYVCRTCEHAAHAHTLGIDAESIKGPYRCHCGCEIAQSSRMARLDQPEAERVRRRPEASAA